MSIGPIDEKDKDLNISIVSQMQYSAKKLTAAFFVDPVYYLFYGSLTGLVIGLFVGMNFSWQFYTVVCGLGLAELGTKLWKQYSTPRI